MTQPPTTEEDREAWASRTDAQRRQILDLEDSQEDRLGAHSAYGSPGISISGWISTLLGIYLIGAGAWSVFETTKDGKTSIIEATHWYLVPDKKWQSAQPIVVLPSNVTLIIAGSGLLALGSIARSSKRSKI